MRRPRGIAPAVAIAALVAGGLFAAPAGSWQLQEAFPHARHARLFPLCTTCHAGVTEPGAPLWPDPGQCASCHDDAVEPRVPWVPRVGPRVSNLRFTHDAHDRAARATDPADSALVGTCSACHNAPGAERMVVQPAVVTNCLECHGLRAAHVDLAPEACGTCHVRLTDAPTLTRERIAAFPTPTSHAAPDFRLGGHGRDASVPAAPGAARGERTVAASCATCHARNLCLACHVNAPESPVIQSLALDARSPHYAGVTPMPAGHAATGFLRSHGKEALRAVATCASCHTRASCTTCHAGAAPRPIAALPESGNGRAPGARTVRAPPPSHTPAFRDRHGAEANARTASCETCHLRSTCLECHRPDGGRTSGFHPRGFIARHPSAAYTRDSNCSDCHNNAQFCQSCHQQSGLVSRARLGRAGYHDAFRGFSLGHGQAARQSLETCVACHTERDCAACHSATGGGFGFNPHGPGFNAARARSRNPGMCIACHGAAIPGDA